MSRKGQRQRAYLAGQDERAEQGLADKARALKARIKKARKENHLFREKRYPEKSMLQILRPLRWELSAFHEAVAIADIKRKWKQNPPKAEDRIFVMEEEEILLQQNHQPPVEEDCPLKP